MASDLVAHAGRDRVLRLGRGCRGAYRPSGECRLVADPRLVAAIVDRVTFNAHILETGTQSYRLRTSRTARGTKAS